MTSPAETRAIDVVTSFLRSFSGNDPDAIAGHVADQFRNEMHSALGSGCVGRDEYRRRLPHFLGAFIDRRYSIDDLVTAQRESVTDVIVRYTFEADYGSHHVKMPGTMWFAVSEGEIVRRLDTFDSLTFLEQTDQYAPRP